MNDSTTLAPDSYPAAAIKSADLLIAEGKPELALHVIEAALHKLAAENEVTPASSAQQVTHTEATEALATKFREASIIYRYRQRPIAEFALKVGIVSAIISFSMMLTAGVIIKLAEPSLTAPVNAVADTVKAQVAQISETIRNEISRASLRLSDSFGTQLNSGIDAKLEKLVEERLPRVIEKRCSP